MGQANRHQLPSPTLMNDDVRHISMLLQSVLRTLAEAVVVEDADAADVNAGDWLLSFDNIRDTILLCAELTREYDPSPDLRHHLDVLINATRIFQSIKSHSMAVLPGGPGGVVVTDPIFSVVNSNRNFNHLLCIIFYVCILHDTLDHKYPNNRQQKIDKVNHFLRSRLSKENWLGVKWIIENISYSKECQNGYPQHHQPIIQLGRDICSDADKLEALGHIGLTRCRQFNLNCQLNSPRSFTKEELDQIVVQHCHDKLLKLKDHYIRTVAGKLLAEPRHQIIVDFVQSYELKSILREKLLLTPKVY